MGIDRYRVASLPGQGQYDIEVRASDAGAFIQRLLSTEEHASYQNWRRQRANPDSNLYSLRFDAVACLGNVNPSLKVVRQVRVIES